MKALEKSLLLIALGSPLVLPLVFSLFLFVGTSLTSLSAQALTNETQTELPWCDTVNSGHDTGWFLTKTEWTAQDEREWQDWLIALYQSKCNSFASCITGSGNKFRKTDPPNIKSFNLFTDCADFPYKLRMYFSWKKGLPFSYVADVKARPLTQTQINNRLAQGQSAEQTDLRYTLNGNEPTERRFLPTGSGYVDVKKVFGRIGDDVGTHTLRINPLLYNQGQLVPDFYPVHIDNTQIKTGTVAYDASGHAAMVIRTYPDGRIDMFDSKSDGSVSRPQYPSFKYFRIFSRADYGVVFQNWRPLRLNKGTIKNYSNTCKYIEPAEQFEMIPNAQIPGMSYEQVTGTNWQPGQRLPRSRVYQVGNTTAENAVDFVRMRLAGGKLQIDPLSELANKIDAICDSVHLRVGQVQGALDEKLPLKRFPEVGDRMANVYGGEGAWFRLSTPSLDLGLRKESLEIVAMAKSFIKRWSAHDNGINYSGNDLREALLEVYQQKARACVVRYQKSDGSMSSTLDLNAVLRRAPALSFSPFDCPERRWGAITSEELRTCTNDAEKDRWYFAMQPIRNNLQKDEDRKMDFTLEELETYGGDLGPAQPPNLDIEGQLRNL
jgi:hypothetical protein